MLLRFTHKSFVVISTLFIAIVCICLTVITEKTAQAQDSQAIVHIYQIQAGMGEAPIYVNGRIVARLSDKRYFDLQLASGKYIFNVSKPNQSTLILEVANGQEYYIKNK